MNSTGSHRLAPVYSLCCSAQVWGIRLVLLFAGALPVFPVHAVEHPNFIVIFCDDLGYGDLGCFGHPTIRTPHLDRMADEGQRWTQFYAAASVCTPSRAGLLTGRLPIRSGMCSDSRGVLFPDSTGGLPASEITLATLLKKQGYATACIGKWHLGHLPAYLPTRHGFDSYFGIPYSNDMDRRDGVDNYAKAARQDADFVAGVSDYNVPLMRDEEIVERPADQRTITRRYGEEAVRLIRQHKDRPFFIYLAHSLPHVPLFCSDSFRGRSPRGLYGDVIEEIDETVGEVLKTLREEGLAENTLVIFTSDNGPWLTQGTHGGSAGPLRDGKGSTWEGGMREPAIFWWPGRVTPGVIRDLGSTLDFFPTLASLAEVTLPEDRLYDGYDLGPVLFGSGKRPRNSLFYYRGEQLYAVRYGDYKAHFTTKTEYVGMQPQPHDPPLLFHLERDPGEQHDVGEAHPEILDRIRELAEAHAKTIRPVENQLSKRE